MLTLRHLLGRALRRPLGRVEYCERCGSVCDARCRADALRDHARDRWLTARFPW